jgi:hypothetical protein
MIGDSKILSCIAGGYEVKKEYKKALKYYVKSYESAPLLNLVTVENIYGLKLKIEGEKSADEFANKALRKISSNQIDEKSALRINALKFCQRIYSYKCPYKL